MTKEEKMNLINSIFEAANEKDDDVLKEILAVLDNIENDLSILVEYFTETI